MRKALFFVLVGLCSTMYLDAKSKDFGTWIELEFTKEFLKDFEFSLIPEIRFEDNFKLDEYMIEGELGYEPFKFLDFSVAYRLGTNVKNGEDEREQRFALDVGLENDFDRLEVSLRNRFTKSMESDDEDPGFYYRPRVKLEYNIKGNKITPFASYELFRNLDHNEFDKQRFDVGATREIAKIHRVGIYYRLQDYIYDRSSIHIVGIEYRLKI
ncbi:MAG TPA: DUF2490 domain-containing protein [Prolixibacteraceae bacterium]|nr:DUF2490 domain-containing protein [Prolixibacteraceae bacterium]